MASPTLTEARSGLRLHVNAVGAVMGGAARHLAPFLGALHSARMEWLVCVWVTSGHEPVDVPDGIAVRSLPRWGASRRLWWESVQLPQVLRRERADALLNLTNSGPLWGQTPSILYQRNALWFDPAWASEFRGMSRLTATARRQLVYLQMRRSAVTIVPSAAMAAILLSRRGAPGAPSIRVVPHGVDTDRFTPILRAWPPPEERQIRIVCVGHAAPHKDQLLLVRLVARLVRMGYDVVLRLTIEPADSPGYVKEIEEECRQLDVQDRVEMLGPVAEVQHLYHWADMMVLPSRTESFGFPIVEAMAAGLPVIASRIASTEELLGSDGWYFTPGDTNGATAAVCEALATSADRLAVITRDAAEVARQLTWASNASQVAVAIESYRRSAGDGTDRG